MQRTKGFLQWAELHKGFNGIKGLDIYYLILLLPPPIGGARVCESVWGYIGCINALSPRPLSGLKAAFPGAHVEEVRP